MHTEWQASIQDMIFSLTDSLNAKKKRKLSPQEIEDLRKAEKELQRIKLDGSIGIHNFMYIEETLESMIKKIGSLD